VNLKLNHIQHVGLPVSNLEISEAFYRKLGFANVMASGFDYKGGRGEIILELYQLPEAQLQEIRNRKDGHIDHIAFDVDSICETFAALKSEDFTIIEDAPVFLPFWNKGCKYFNILGPDGERLEFNQILMDPLR
jgi:lactoylglutathione lyase